MYTVHDLSPFHSVSGTVFPAWFSCQVACCMVAVAVFPACCMVAVAVLSANSVGATKYVSCMLWWWCQCFLCVS